MLTEKEISIIGEKMIEQKESIAWIVEDLSNQGNEFSENAKKIDMKQVIQLRAEFIGLIGECLTIEHQGQELEKVYEWGKRTGDYGCRMNVPLDEALLALPHYRKAIYEFINTEFRNEELTFNDYYILSERINPVIDKATYAFTQSYVEYNEKVFNKAKEELIELSVPIVPLTKDVAILPLVGTLDTYRAKELLEKTLETGSSLGLEYLIIDLSGVHMIDTAVAHNLIQLHSALKLVGITAIIAGLRPELAQTMVALGISLKEMKVVHSLPQALPLTGLRIDSGQ